MRRLSLDPRLRALLGQRRHQPLGGPPLPLGGGGAVDLLQFLELRAQPLLFPGISRGSYRWLTGGVPPYHLGQLLGGGSITLSTFEGIRIAVDWSWFLVLFLVIFGCRTPTATCWACPDPPANGPFLLAVLSAAGFSARSCCTSWGTPSPQLRNGIGISSIQLWIFGGMARMDREAESPGSGAQGGPSRAAGDLPACSSFFTAAGIRRGGGGTEFRGGGASTSNSGASGPDRSCSPGSPRSTLLLLGLQHAAGVSDGRRPRRPRTSPGGLPVTATPPPASRPT